MSKPTSTGGMAEPFTQFQYENENDIKRPGIDFFDLVDLAWSVKKTVFICTILAVMLGLLFVLIYRQITYTDRYEYTIQLTFPSVVEGNYPNGTPFRLSDIIAPNILEEVYTKNNLQDNGIDLDSFVASVLITSFSESRRAIIEKYRIIFDERKSTLAEIEQNQRDLETELERESRTAALLRLEDRTGRLEVATAQTILVDIVNIWSKQAIAQKGVLKDGIQIINPKLLETASIEGLENLNKLRIILSRFQNLSDALTNVSNAPGGRQAVEKQNGFSTLDVKSQLENVMLKLREVAAKWPEQAASDPSVQRLSNDLFSGIPFSLRTIANEEYLVQLDIFDDALKIVEANIDTILSQPFGGLAVDPKTKLTAVDITQALNDLKNIDLQSMKSPILQNGIAKDYSKLVSYYQTKMSELNVEKRKLRRKVETVVKAVQPNDIISQNGNDNTASLGTGNSTFMPQLGERFIDRIVELSQQGSDAEFRRDLIQQAIDFQIQEAEIDSQLDRYSNYIDIVLINNQSELPADKELLREGLETSIKERLKGLFEQITKFAEATIRISRRLRHANDIHQIIETEENSQINVDYYLRNNALDTTSKISDVMSELQSISGTIARLRAEIDEETYGSVQRLFRPLGTPDEVNRSFFGTRSLILVLGLMVIGFFASLILAMFFRYKSALSDSQSVLSRTKPKVVA